MSGWMSLGLDERANPCATEGCSIKPSWELMVGGIGSVYCSKCKSKMEPHRSVDSGRLVQSAHEIGGETAIAALYVETGGSYFGLDGVDPWDQERDARRYDGPYPVVAHPPCQRWGKFWAGQPLHIKRTGERKVKGADDGCFAAALYAVRTWGGVLEHPEGSHAWAHFGLNEPPRSGGWIAADFRDGWTCCVEQRGYGHYARKPTWLYACKVDLPELKWGKTERQLDPAVVARMGLKRAIRLGEVGSKGGGRDSTPRIGTPTEFRDLLISLARSVKSAAVAA